MTIPNQLEGLTHPCPSIADTMTVPEYYKGKHVFVTGATGFMGKVLIEKLLWSCSDIGKIYILIRRKKDVLPEARIQELLKLPLFERLREKKPHLISKIVPIHGDIMEDRLGIKEEDRRLLENNVSIIFHAAASVRFDDPLKRAILLNVRGTRDVIELAENMKNLEVMTYVSTTYCNSDRRVIEERVYPSEYDWRTMLKLAETTDEHTFNILEKKILTSKPNTYTFTKQLAESVISEYSTRIPSVIFRPSIVTFTIDEPIAGWVDNLNGPVGLSVGIIMGVIHVMYANQDCNNDYMPCDYAIKGLILAAWYKGISKNKDCQVINAASGSKATYTIGSLGKRAHRIIEDMPPNRMLWYPSFVVTDNPTFFYLMTIFTQLLPGALIDIVLYLKGIKFSMIRLYRKIYMANQCLAYFITNDWKIVTDNYNSLPRLLSKSDKEEFFYDMGALDENYALNIGQMGVKKFITNEDVSESAVAAAKIKNKRMYWLHFMLRLLFTASILWISSKLFTKHILPYINNLL